MAFTRSLLDQACTLLHHSGELSHLEIGITLPQLMLITPDRSAELIVLSGGIPDTAGNALPRRPVAQIGAVSAANTVESWLGFVSAPPEGFERLAPDDLPRATDLPDRREAVVTTAVWPGGEAFVHRITVITRTPSGPR